MALAAKLKELRIKHKKSLQEVADEVRASKAHIWDLETGKSKNPSLELLVKLAKCFKVSVADLVGEKSNKQRRRTTNSSYVPRVKRADPQRSRSNSDDDGSSEGSQKIAAERCT